MSNPVSLQSSFNRMVRDHSRDGLPGDAAWNIQDYVPHLGAPLRKRGGWPYHGVTLNSLNASAGLPARVAVASFSGGVQVVAIDSSIPRLFDLTAGVDRGSVNASVGPLIFYRELLIIPGSNPQKYTGSGAPASLAGSPPEFSFGTVHKDRLAVGPGPNLTAPNRIYFSGAGNAESWDTTNRYIDTSAQVVQMASLRNALLVFHKGSVERIRGDIPPGSAAANMTLEPLFDDVGIFENDALAVSGEFAYFADESGVYKTDGSNLADLTKQGEIKTYWQTQFASVGSTGSIALGVWRGYLFCSMQAVSDVFVDFLVCDIERRHWFRFTNIRAYNFATQYGATDELYFSNRDTSSKRVGKLSDVFAPTASVKNDADGDAVTPVLETGLYDFDSPELKRWRFAYVTHDTRDAASDNPVQTVSYLASPEETSYTALSPTLPETSGITRVRRPISAPQSYGMAFKIAQTGASSDTRLYGIGAHAEAKERSRLKVA